MNDILFHDNTHKSRFKELLKAYTNNEPDSFRTALAYLIALTDETYKNRRRLYDEQERCIIPNGLNAAFQTGTTKRLTLLAFNLFTGSTAFCDDVMQSSCTPDNIFSNELAPYFVEAIKLRYPLNFIDLDN
jgi:hypothetical protein